MKLKKELLCMLALLVSITARAYDIELNGIYYNITDADAKTVEVTYVEDGDGNVDFYYNSIVIPPRISTGGVTYTVTAIGDKAFAKCKNVSSVSLPSTLQSIGGEAFLNSGLTSITIPSSVTEIKTSAFNGCGSLETVSLSEGLTKIGEYAFYCCWSLASINIPETVTEIGYAAFQNCTHMTSANIPSGITTISGYLFCGCPLTSITIPDGVTSIGEWAFHGCDLSSIVIPESMETIGGNAFRGIKALKSITIPEGLKIIEGDAFRDSGLESINLPSTMERMENNVFAFCKNLETVVLPSAAILNGWSNKFLQCTSLKTVTFHSGDAAKSHFSNNFSKVPDDVLFIIPEGTAESFLKKGYKNLSDKSGLSMVREEFEAEAEHIATMAGNLSDGEKTALTTAISEARTVVNATDDYMEVFAQIAAIKDAAKTFISTATLPENFDVTAATVINPDFDRFDHGWKLSLNAWEIGYIETQYTNQDVTIDHFTETWANGWALGNGKISQNITNLPAGIYRLECDAIATWQNDASVEVTGVSLFAGNAKKAVATENEKPQHFSVEFEMITKGNITIGLSIYNTNANWVAMDNVRLYYVDSAEKLFASASSEHPIDVTSYIVNPSFDENNADGWEGSTPLFQSYNNAEFYQTTFDIHQTISRLPNGNYLLKAKGFHRPGSNQDVFTSYNEGTNNASAQLYANAESTTLENQARYAQDSQAYGGASVTYNNETYYVPNSMEEARRWFDADYYENELPVTVTDGTLTIGIRLDESVGNGWVIFDDFQLAYLGIEHADIAEGVYYLKNTETGKLLNRGNAWGMRAVLADEGLPARLEKQANGSYTITFTEGSQRQRKLFQHGEVGVWVDYDGQSDGRIYWNITNGSADGTYHIQSLSKEYYFGNNNTYLGNNPTKEAVNENNEPLGVYNDVDGNITATEGMNITWQLIPEAEHRRIEQAEQLQMLIDLGTKLGVSTSSAEAVMNNHDATIQQAEDAIGSLKASILQSMGNGIAPSLVPLDITALITNPSFVFDSAYGWEGSTPQFQVYNNAEFFQTTFDTHQTISGLPNGIYKLQAKGFHRPGAYNDVYTDYMGGTDNASAKLYANDESLTLANIARDAQDTKLSSAKFVEVSYQENTQYLPDNMQSAATCFANNLYENELTFTVTDGTLTFGIRLDESVEKDWVIFDDFQLAYLGKDVSMIDNVIYIEDMEARTGAQTTVSLKMKNTAAIRGFQFDLYLPEGVTLAKNNKGKFITSLSAGRLDEDDEHTLTVSQQEDGSYRFLCGSLYEETFLGNDGEIATMALDISENMEEGDYPVYLRNIKLTENDISNYYETAELRSKLTISSYILGDINGDGKVDVSDYIGVANRILGNTPAGFNEKAADVDENGVIDVSDYIGVANIILTGSIYGSQHQSRIWSNGFIE